METIEFLIVTLITLLLVITLYRVFLKGNKPDNSEALISGLMKEIDRLYRLNNFHITRDNYLEQEYVKYIKDDLININIKNGQMYKEKYHVERPYKTIENC